MHSRGFSDLYPFKKLFLFHVTWGKTKWPNLLQTGLFVPTVESCSPLCLAGGSCILPLMDNTDYRLPVRAYCRARGIKATTPTHVNSCSPPNPTAECYQPWTLPCCTKEQVRPWFNKLSTWLMVKLPCISKLNQRDDMGLMACSYTSSGCGAVGWVKWLLLEGNVGRLRQALGQAAALLPVENTLHNTLKTWSD